MVPSDLEVICRYRIFGRRGLSNALVSSLSHDKLYALEARGLWRHPEDTINAAGR